MSAVVHHIKYPILWWSRGPDGSEYTAEMLERQAIDTPSTSTS